MQEPVCNWLKAVLSPVFVHMSLPTLALIYICFFLLIYSFFNIFVSCIFWYFFNDVVPENLMARFVSWFRIVNAGASTLYNWFIFKHAETHFMEIFVGAGLLYLVGFGMMCLKVKEGKYPPPPENIGGQKGAVASVKTYFTECMTTRHYWYLYLTTLGAAITMSANLYTIFLQRHIGLSLDQIGKLSAISNISYITWIAVLGFLADRFHPLRITIIGKTGALILAPLGLVWLFWRPPSDVVFYYYVVLSALGTTAIGALSAIVEIPLLMKIFPRSQYGQFCSARAMCGSFFAITASAFTGFVLDYFQKSIGDRVYLFLPIWSIVGLSITIVSLLLLYRSWKQHGGFENYVAPIPGHDRKDSVPEPT
jgi:maltose/moltooligosaccharide transporter